MFENQKNLKKISKKGFDSADKVDIRAIIDVSRSNNKK